MSICIIPARGNSKRIPRKNIKNFCGKPMIAWSIEKATQSGCFDQIIVNTDDDEIADISLQFGADLCLERNKKNSDDYTTISDVIVDSIDSLDKNCSNLDYVCCLLATAPLLSINDLISAYNLLINENVEYVFPVSEFEYPIQRSLRMNSNNSVSMYNTIFHHTRSQDLEIFLRDAGQFYWGLKQAWLSKKPLFQSKNSTIKIPRKRAIDIDDENDWFLAEKLFELSLSIN